jgi:outer membrane protein assembly factor BamB
MIAAEEFVALLEQKDLVSPEIVAHLRRQIARPGSPISAALIAKWLVDRGHLSRILAQRLLTRAEEVADATKPPREAEFDWERQAEAEEELGLAPLDDEISSVPATKKRPKPPAEFRAIPPRAPASGRARTPEQKPPPAPPVGGSLLDEEVYASGAGGSAGVGPLDGLADESSLIASDTDGGPLTPLAPKKGLFGLGGRRRRRRRENVWDSPLLLIGGGTLLLLVFLLGIFIWAVNQRTGDETLAAADEYYKQGSYTKAIAQYDEYLKDFPNHSGVSGARVRRGLARLRQSTDYSTDWSESLAVAQEVLAEIAQEETFRTEAGAELVAILPKIAQGLADKARADLDAALVAKAEEALALVNKYIPSKSRPVTKLADIEALLALTKREIARGEELEKSLAAMAEAVEQNKTAEAYEIRTALLKAYPTLLDNERLQEMVRKVSRAQLSEVKLVERSRPAEAVQSPSTTLATVALASRTSDTPPPGSEGHVVFVLAEGAAYGLNAETGEILWRRPVGFATNGRNPAFPPTPIADKAGSDALIVDAERHQVLRVEATTGRPRWKHPLEERFDAHPVVAGERLLVATRSGQLVSIDLDSGNSPSYIQLPQELRVGPTVDFRRSRIYQVAEHSNLFVLSLDDGKAMQIVYLGHAPGTVTVSPVVVNRYLIVAENGGVEHATLHVLALEAKEEGQPPVRVVQSVRIKGHVDAPPQVYGVRMLVASDQGELDVFEISATDAENPLARVAQGQAASAEDAADQAAAQGLVRFPLMRAGQVWIADSQLTAYDLHPSQGRLQPTGVKNERSATLQPLTAIGQTVFHVRRRIGLPGVIVSAIGAEQKEPYWEVHLAAPLVTEPMIDAQTGQITAVTAIGAIFQLERDRLQGQAVADQPTLALKPMELRGPVAHVTPVKDNLLVMASAGGETQLPVFDPREGKRFRWLFLPDPLAGPPLAYEDGLLVPCQAGQVFLLDPRSGDARAEPFQPALRSGVRVVWSRPVLDDEGKILLAEGHSGLYRIELRSQQKPHLAMLSQVDLAEPLASPVAVLGNTAYAVDDADSLVSFQLPKLTPGQPRPLAASSAWGPGRVGDSVLLATDDDQLYCLDDGGKIVWQVALRYGPLAGAPLKTDDGYLLAATGGTIWRVEPTTGRELGRIETGQPLGTGPVALGDGLLVGGHDGCLYQVKMP